MNSDRAIFTAGEDDNEFLHPCRGFSPLSAHCIQWNVGWEDVKKKQYGRREIESERGKLKKVE